MTEDKRKPLPKPQNSPFGAKKRFGEDSDKGSLMADEMASAAVSGRLEEYLSREVGENDNARKLVGMMMGEKRRVKKR